MLEDTLKAQPLCLSGFGSEWVLGQMDVQVALCLFKSPQLDCVLSDTNSSPGAQVRQAVMLWPSSQVTLQGCSWWAVTSQLAFSLSMPGDHLTDAFVV